MILHEPRRRCRRLLLLALVGTLAATAATAHSQRAEAALPTVQVWPTTGDGAAVPRSER